MKKFKAKNFPGILPLSLAVLCISILLSSCSSTFIVNKDGKGYFFGGSRDELYKMLCDSGDLLKIIEDTHFPKETKDALYKYNCLQRSGDKVKEIYASLAPEQRRELRLSFQLHGYDINYLDC